MPDSGYKEKEKAIFSGIIALIKQGINPYSIKVSDIALEANVGKGTIYDYFSSKEEVISKAILNYIGIQLQAAYQQVKAKTSFKDKYYQLLDLLVGQAEENKLYCKLLSPLGGTQDFYEHLAAHKAYFLANTTWIQTIYEDLFEAGEAEAIIQTGDPADAFYREMAITGSLAAFLQYLYRPQPNAQTDEAKAASYRLLLKALN